jgi:hypothetical protein
MADSAISEFNKKGYDNIELRGFYWQMENLRPNKWDPAPAFDTEAAIAFNDYVHSLGYISLWCPYYSNIVGIYHSLYYGFDITLWQPNHVFSASEPQRLDIISELAKIYKNHEVAAHTLTHPHLPPLPDDEVIRQVERDRLNLSDIVGYEVVGMAYPGGGMNNNDRVARLIKSHTGIKYARTISLGYSFLPQPDLYRYKPTAFHLDFKDNYRLAKDFFEREEEGVFYIWGHSYEFDINDTWGEFEDFCKYVSGRDDIFYGTNREILL